MLHGNKYYYLLITAKKAKLEELNDLHSALQPAIYAGGPPTGATDSR